MSSREDTGTNGVESTRTRPKKTGLIRDESQEDRAIKLLVERSRQGEWTEARELSEKVSLQYSRVIWSLRKRGFEIENRLEVVDGVRLGFFRLVVPEVTPSLEGAHQAQLFGDSIKYFDPEEAMR